MAERWFRWLNMEGVKPSMLSRAFLNTLLTPTSASGACQLTCVSSQVLLLLKTLHRVALGASPDEELVEKTLRSLYGTAGLPELRIMLSSLVNHGHGRFVVDFFKLYISDVRSASLIVCLYLYN
jgi:hypothetical protein